MNAADILAYGQRTLENALADVPAAAWTTPGACGQWSVKDIVAHLASYELVIVDVLTAFVQEDPTPQLDRFLAAGPAFNDAEVAARSAKSPEEVRDELAAAHRQTLALIAAIPEERRRRPGTLPWYGLEYALDDLLVYMVYGHKREHAAQIALFGNRLRSLAGTQSAMSC